MDWSLDWKCFLLEQTEMNLFGLSFQAYDRHVAWCEEKTRRLQTSPTKDMVALAKLHARNSYRPKTPSRYAHAHISFFTSFLLVE